MIPCASPTSKQADFNMLPGLPASQVWDRTKRYGPMGLAIGAGTAGLVNLLGEYRRNKAEQQAQADAASGKADNDTLVVRVPQKEAGWKVPSLVTAGVAGLGTAAGVGIHDYLQGQTPAGQAQQQHEIAARPNAMYEDAMDWGIPIAAGVGGYGLVDAIMRRRKQNDLQGQLDHEKKDYSDLLGQTLGEPGAKSAAVRFPALEGFIAGLADELSAPPSEPTTKTAGLLDRITSAPALLALTSAVVAHKFVHDQEVKADQANAIKKFAPPKAIRIQTVPSPVQDLPMPSAAQDDEATLAPSEQAPIDGEPGEDERNLEARRRKLAGFGELAELGGDAVMAGGGKKMKGEGGESDKDDDASAGNPPEPEPIIHDLSRNEARIDTAAGNVGIQAADPGAVDVLQHCKARLARLLAVSGATA